MTGTMQKLSGPVKPSRARASPLAVSGPRSTENVKALGFTAAFIARVGANKTANSVLGSFRRSGVRHRLEDDLMVCMAAHV